MKVTTWYKFIPEQQVYKYNHYTEGWVDKDQVKPTEFDSFSEHTWAKQYEYLKEHTIVNG